MITPDLATFLTLVAARRGHFRMESGLHSELWLDLSPLFADSRSVEPFVAALTAAIRPYDVALVCGPLVGGAFLAQLMARALGVEFAFTERVQVPDEGGLYQARYQLPAPMAARVGGRRVAMVDDVMSAGSSLRATHAELERHGAVPVVAGALLVLGSAGADFFARHHVAVEAIVRDGFSMWSPEACPLCGAGVAIEDVSA